MSPAASILLTLFINHMGKFYVFFFIIRVPIKKIKHGNKNKHNIKKKKVEIQVESLSSLSLQPASLPKWEHWGLQF